MPLKADDLKTVESYKKAVKFDVGRLGPQGNIKFWIYKDVELPTASGSKQKLPVLIALVDESATKATLKGKQPLCNGLCGLRDGEVFFEAQRGKVPYELMKKNVPLLLGKPLHVPDGAEESEEEGEEDSGGSLPEIPNGPTGTYARLNAYWKMLSKEADNKLGDPDLRPTLMKLLESIPEMLQTGRLSEAEKRLAELYSIVKKPAQPKGSGPGGPSGEKGAPSPGLVKYRAALVQFAQAKTQVKGQIHNLRIAIMQQAPDQKDFANELATKLEGLNEELSGAVDEAIAAAHNESSPATTAVKTKVRKYLSELASNQLVKKADTNPLGVQVAIGKTLGGALERIRDTMPA